MDSNIFWLLRDFLLLLLTFHAQPEFDILLLTAVRITYNNALMILITE